MNEFEYEIVVYVCGLITGIVTGLYLRVLLK
jgi:hypothetical protein